MTLLRTLGRKLHFAINQRKQRVILAHADILAGMQPGTTLANNDAAGIDGLTAVDFDAKPFRLRVTAVTRRAAAFLCAI